MKPVAFTAHAWHLPAEIETVVFCTRAGGCAILMHFVDHQQATNPDALSAQVPSERAESETIRGGRDKGGLSSPEAPCPPAQVTLPRLESAHAWYQPATMALVVVPAAGLKGGAIPLPPPETVTLPGPLPPPRATTKGFCPCTAAEDVDVSWLQSNGKCPVFLHVHEPPPLLEPVTGHVQAPYPPTATIRVGPCGKEMLDMGTAIGDDCPVATLPQQMSPFVLLTMQSPQ